MTNLADRALFGIAGLDDITNGLARGRLCLIEGSADAGSNGITPGLPLTNFYGVLRGLPTLAGGPDMLLKVDPT